MPKHLSGDSLGLPCAVSDDHSFPIPLSTSRSTQLFPILILRSVCGSRFNLPSYYKVIKPIGQGAVCTTPTYSELANDMSNPNYAPTYSMALCALPQTYALSGMLR